MEFIRKNKTFAENIVYNYLNGLDDGKDLVQEGYMIAVENQEIGIFNKIYSLSKLEPNEEVRGLIGKIFSKSGDKKFSDLIKEF